MTNNYEDFYKALKNQQDYLLDGGTTYRKDTAALSLFVASKVNKVEPFLDRNYTEQLVRSYLPSEDHYRVSDVTKMLWHNANDQEFHANLSPRLKKQIEQRKAEGKYRLSNK